MILGFTGTRQGLTSAQRAALPSVLATLPERVLHGGAVGADTQFDAWLCDLEIRSARPLTEDERDARWTPRILIISIPRCHVEVYPIGPKRWDYWDHLQCERRFIHYFNSDPLARNREIVARCDHLLACPAEPDEQIRSGTWATVRYARAAVKPITLLLPDGTVREERR